MKAISLWQPWATLMAAGYKRIETRSWEPRGLRKGQLVAIHAAKHWTRDERELIESDDLFQLALQQAAQRGLWSFEQPPLGCVVAIARYYGCAPTERIRMADLKATATPDDLARIRWWLPLREYEFGNFSGGRFGWAFSEVRPLTPIPARGMQGIFDWMPPAEMSYLEPVNALPRDVMPTGSETTR